MDLELAHGSYAVPTLDRFNDAIVFPDHLVEVFGGLHTSKTHQARKTSDLLEQSCDYR